MRSWLAIALAAMCPCVMLGQAGLLRIQVVEGEGGVHAPGARLQRPIVIEVSDDSGRPVPGAAVSFTLPEDGPGGRFSNGLRTDVITTDGRGRAYLRTLQMNRTEGRFAVRITASKEQARAGAISLQYIAGAGATSGVATAPRASTSAPAVPAARASAPARHSGRKWTLAVLAAGAAVAGGVAAAAMVGHPAASTTAVTASAPVAIPTPAGPSIGIPTISVGHP